MTHLACAHATGMLWTLLTWFLCWRVSKITVDRSYGMNNMIGHFHCWEAFFFDSGLFPVILFFLFLQCKDKKLARGAIASLKWHVHVPMCVHWNFFSTCIVSGRYLFRLCKVAAKNNCLPRAEWPSFFGGGLWIISTHSIDFYRMRRIFLVTLFISIVQGGGYRGWSNCIRRVYCAITVFTFFGTTYGFKYLARGHCITCTLHVFLPFWLCVLLSVVIFHCYYARCSYPEKQARKRHTNQFWACTEVYRTLGVKWAWFWWPRVSTPREELEQHATFHGYWRDLKWGCATHTYFTVTWKTGGGTKCCMVMTYLTKSSQTTFHHLSPPQ